MTYLRSACHLLFCFAIVCPWLAVSAPVAAAQEPRARLTLEQNGVVWGVQFSPDGKTLAAESGTPTTLSLLDAATGKPRQVLPSGASSAFTFSPDGKTLAWARVDGSIGLWEIAAGKNRLSFAGHPSAGAQALAFTPDGTILVSGSQDNTIVLWDVRNGKKTATFTGHQLQVNSVACSPDGRIVASASRDKTIKLWDVLAGINLKTIETAHRFNAYRVVFSPDGKTLASGGMDSPLDVGARKPIPKQAPGQFADGQVKLWDIATGKNIKTFDGHLGTVYGIAFSPDGTMLASASRDATVKIWYLATTREPVTLKGHTEYVRCLAFSPDGKTLATGSKDKTIKLWDIGPGR